MAVWSGRLQSSLRQPPDRSLLYQMWFSEVKLLELFLNLEMEKSSEKERVTGDTMAALAPTLESYSNVIK